MRDILSKSNNPVTETKDIREVDDRTIVLLFRASGFAPIAVEADRMKLIYIFSRSETKELMGKVLGNEPILIDWQKYVAAEEEWKHALSALKELRGRE